MTSATGSQSAECKRRLNSKASTYLSLTTGLQGEFMRRNLFWKPPKSPEHPHADVSDEEKLFLIYVNARAANMFSWIMIHPLAIGSCALIMRPRSDRGRPRIESPPRGEIIGSRPSWSEENRVRSRHAGTQVSIKASNKAPRRGSNMEQSNSKNR